MKALCASEPCMSYNDSFLLQTEREDRRWSRNQVNDLHTLMLSTASYCLGFQMIIYDGPWYDSLGSEALKMGHCDLSLGYKSCLEENLWWSCLWSTFAIYRTSSTSIAFSAKKYLLFTVFVTRAKTPWQTLRSKYPLALAFFSQSAVT